MGVALRHDRRFMPQEPLHLIQVDPGLNHPRRERMAKIVEMEIVDLRTVEREVQRSPDVAPITGSSPDSFLLNMNCLTPMPRFVGAGKPDKTPT
jgi:hypothetical protein